MLSVRAIYDGEKVTLLEKVEIKGPKEVIITFLDNETSQQLQRDIYKLSEQSNSFDFLKEPVEDIYSDKHLKKKY
ncbi:hypothetical protein ASZ90_004380 [hydrocarbon metagenome]|uniref:DUF104 domain-containing protein n=1 Tax=hydrocarbon metagenome TaxID=938273 RepID=A0A0W8FXZ5_9ZZZZ